MFSSGVFCSCCVNILATSKYIYVLSWDFSTFEIDQNCNWVQQIVYRTLCNYAMGNFLNLLFYVFKLSWYKGTSLVCEEIRVRDRIPGWIKPNIYLLISCTHRNNGGRNYRSPWMYRVRELERYRVGRGGLTRTIAPPPCVRP